MDRISTIAFAIKNEAKETAYYLNESRRSNNPITRVLFKRLAEDEQKQVEKIKILHKKLLAEGRWPEDIPLEVAGTNVMEALENIGRAHKSASYHDDDDIRALKRAIEVEKEGKALYEKLAASSLNATEKEFFQFLAKIEGLHLKSIVESLAYLEDPEGYYVSKGCSC